MAQQTVSGADISLYHVAAAELDDPTQFYRILQVNGMTDPMLSGVQTISIPGPMQTSTDGVPPQ